MANNDRAVVEPLQDPQRRKTYHWNRWGALKTERGSWDSHAADLARFLLPRSSRFTTSETNKGGPKHNNILDNTVLRGPRILAAGMMSGMTSPARPWMRLKVADDDLMDYEPVKVWCAAVTRECLNAFANSNTYRTLHQGYTELGVFGTHAALLMPDAKTKIHTTSFTFGEYAIAQDARGVVDTLYREFQMTAGAMVREYGYDNCSTGVQQAYNRGALDTKFDVVHAIEPNYDMDERKADWRSMPFRSCYFEQARSQKDEYLREGGFKRFRGLCPRWSVTSGDTYGESPGMEALGDSKQLQHEQLRKSQGIDYMTKPPVGLPTSMKGAEVDMLPGGVTFFDQAGGNMGGQRQLFDVKLDLNHLLMDIQDIRGRVNSAFYADLFMMIAAADKNGMTATEVAERHEEKLLMLGPVLERLNNETIQPLIDMTFDELLESGSLPPPPPELEGMPLETELLGMLAQAQRAVQTSSLDRFAMSVMQIAQIKPEVIDKINTDEFVEIYADSLGADPRVLVDDREVAKVREARAQQQAIAAKDAQAEQASKTAANLGGVTTDSGNLGADVIGLYSGYGSPQVGRPGPM